MAMRYDRVGDEMAKLARKLSYKEFVESLPEVLDSIAREDKVVLVEKDGVTFSVEQAGAEGHSKLPPTPPPEVVRRILKETAGGFHTPDREGFLKELREARGQDSEGRPA